MAKNKAAKDGETIDVMHVERGEVRFCVLGTSPLILNRMSEKTKRELLLPKGKKNAAEKASSMKHDPLAEFAACAYRDSNAKAPTLLLHLSSAFKGAIRAAALDLPGTSKAQIGRLTYVSGDFVSVYGIPKLLMSITRSADIKKTPDVRTRVIVPRWACMVTVLYAKPILREQTVANLFAAAGLISGTGDWRPEKGSGNYGTFRLADADDEEYEAVMKEGGRKAQEKAMSDPEAYDDETRELLTWFDSEARRRGFREAA